VLVGAFGASRAAAQRSPRLEKLALEPADMAKAKSATSRLADLTSAWQGGTVSAVDSSAPDCAWQDYSAFTMTGRSEADFAQGPAEIISIVQIFRTHAQALGDFAVDTRAGTAKCEAEIFQHAFGSTTSVVSATTVAAPKVGDTASAIQIVLKAGPNRFYANVVEFVRDRAIAGLVTLSVDRPLADRAALVRLMDERLHAGVA